MRAQLDHRDLYRLPWSLPDNAIGWLEPTEKCNLACHGCYRANADRHKSLREVADELDVFERLRTIDALSIAGGDPLMHPQIVEVVAMAAGRGWKPILNTNGLALDALLLRELKRAGLCGLTFHVDSKQNRPKWKGRSEEDLNELRLGYAEMVAEVGGVACAFNSTVFEDTLDAVPGLVAWAHGHIDVVHTMIFICLRAVTRDGEYDYYVGNHRVDMSALVYGDPLTEERTDVTAPDVVAKIRERLPDFAPCAYLNGTERPDSFKWLLTGCLGTPRRTYGYVGPKMAEIAQALYHLRKGRYLSYASPSALSHGRTMLLLWPFDSGLRRALGHAARQPTGLLRRVYYQSIMVIQPVDVLPDGRQNMCDGCPDMTVWDGRLGWSCRLEEYTHFGAIARTVPHADREPTAAADE